MSTKYPLNGRTTTIYDLITEFGETSTWPTNLISNEANASIEGWSPTEDQPFKQLIIDKLSDRDPNAYEIVWFNDDIYSDKLYDYINKQYAVIQYNDTRLSKSGEQVLEIRAEDMTGEENDDIYNKGIKYKFIVGNKKKEALMSYELNQHYYNYKCDNGQARVIYALQNIIDTINDYDKMQKYLFINTTDENEQYCHYSLLTSDASKFVLNDTLYDLIIKFSEDKYIVNPSAYDTLGSYFWTYFNVNYDNYTTKYKHKKFVNGITKYSDSSLRQEINWIINDVYEVFDTSNYTYYDNNQVSKLYYYTYMFLNTQRHFVSYITSCMFIRVSDTIYQRNQPLLRCDISLLRFIENVRVLNAVHTPRTALMPGVLEGTTTLEFDITIEIKYKNIEQPTITTITLTKNIYTIKNVTEHEDTHRYEFYREVIPAVADSEYYVTPSINNSEIDDPLVFLKYGQDYFIDVTQTTSDKSNLFDSSWPFNLGNQLQLTKTQFNQLQTLKDKYNGQNSPAYVDSYDIDYYTHIGETTPSMDFLKDKSFFGLLRIHNTYKQPPQSDVETEESNNSSYYFDVSILRFKNFYYIEYYQASTDPDKPDSTELSLYYTPIYQETNYILPNVSISSVKIEGDNQGGVAQYTQTQIDELFEQVDPNTYYIVRNDVTNVEKFNELYMYVLTKSGNKKTYLSGYEVLSETTTNNYNTNIDVTDFEIYYSNATNDNNWQLLINIYYNITKRTIDNTTCYLFKFNDNLLSNISHIRIKINDLSNNYYYFRIAPYVAQNNKMTIYYLYPISSGMTSTEYKSIQFLTYSENNVNNIKYTSLHYLENSANDYAEVYVNNLTFFIKMTSLSMISSSNIDDNTGYVYQLNESNTMYTVYDIGGTYKDDTVTLFDELEYSTDNNSNIFISWKPIIIINVVNGEIDTINLQLDNNILAHITDNDTNIRYIFAYNGDLTLPIKIKSYNQQNTIRMSITHKSGQSTLNTYSYNYDPTDPNNRNNYFNFKLLGRNNYRYINVTFVRTTPPSPST